MTQFLTELVDAAVEMIAEEGLGSVSLTSLARRAGVSRASTYREFGDKNGLVSAVARSELERMSRQALDEIDLLASSGDLVRATMLFALRYLRGHAALRRVIAYEPMELINVAVQHEGSMLNLVETVAALIIPLLALRAEDDLIEAFSPEQAAEIMVRTVLSHVLIERSTLTDDQVADMMVRALLR
ncbi:helix-turn-helix domain-containing protein [Nocardia sp. NPDC046473]|uniref:TetR/AcrR family transcriptional regulator n=1 Tax=Nocardia sp. NPDC046473 TaxID=3155733 RepID=UPI0033CB90D2